MPRWLLGELSLPLPPRSIFTDRRLTIPSGAVCCIGGPALVYYVSPTEEELFLKYNPELQKRSLENRRERQEDFDNFVMRLREYSKSDKPSKSRLECEVDNAIQAG
jgi:hypothetical protein